MHFRDGADASTEYEYDKNGNMTKDLNKGIAGIEYNSLNLPLNIRHNNGNMEHYTYSAAGTKLCATSRTLSVGVLSPMTGVMQQSSAVSPRDGEIHFTYYCGNVIYDGNVTRILTDEGYVTFNGTTPVYHYYLKDHLGNNRVVLGQNGAVEQVNHYYPFGGLMGESIGGSTQPYKYNGKELDRTNGLDWCDYGARWYDATRTGWTSVDPLCEKYYYVSPYVYCMNNPTKFIDPDGRDTYLYATTLPGSSLPFATHTFIVVTNKKGDVQGYFAYGSEYDGIKGAFGGQLVQRSYDQDLSIINGQDKEDLKSKLLVDPPKGMTTESFDKKVMDVGNSFGNDPGITYNVIPTKPTEGNCNTSTSTILLKAGVSKSKLDELEKKIPGINTGFDNQPHPWYAKEQKAAVESERKVKELENVLFNNK